jgi:hypothetical protein
VAYYSQFPWQLYCTFTFPRRLRYGDEQARTIWNEFLSFLEAAHPDTICRLVAEESQHAHGVLAGIRLHYHALFASDTPIGETVIRDLWHKLVGNGKKSIEIDRYDPCRGAVGYCLKTVGSPDHGNITTYNDDLYAAERSVDWNKTAATRRRWRRQLERRAKAESLQGPCQLIA